MIQLNRVWPGLFTVIAVVIISLVTTHAAKVADSQIVGARIVTCRSCRLNHLPQVKGFISLIAPNYPSLEVQYIHGRDPMLFFLNIHAQVVHQQALATLSKQNIVDTLERFGITTSTVKPTFTPPVFEETVHCVAWRQTGGCNARGEREAMNDEDCLESIGKGRSGYCVCKKVVITESHSGGNTNTSDNDDGSSVSIPSADSDTDDNTFTLEYTCDHHGFSSCDEVCRSSNMERQEEGSSREEL